MANLRESEKASEGGSEAADWRAGESPNSRGSGGAHLSEGDIHAFLDGELAVGEHAAVQEHLATCEQCRRELAALRRLFIALDELAPAPDLVPTVRARLAGLSPALPQRSWRRWLPLALEAAAAVALLAWAVTRPAAFWAGLFGTWPADFGAELSGWWSGTWGSIVAWLASLWADLPSWPADTWSALQAWLGSLPTLDLQLSLPQWALWVGLLVVACLVGNALLLRRAALNGHTQ